MTLQWNCAPVPADAPAEKLNSCCAISYSLFSEVWNIAGSSVLKVIISPSSKNFRTGCSCSSLQAPVRRLLVMHISTGTCFCAITSSNSGRSQRRVRDQCAQRRYSALPDRFRPRGLAGMRCQPQTIVSSFFVQIAKPSPRSARLVAANSHTDNVALAQPRSQDQRLLPQLPDRIAVPASKIHSSDTPKSRWPRSRPRSMPSKIGSTGCPRQRITPTLTYTSAWTTSADAAFCISRR